MYDRLVGAGTYIFRMNDETCVDATRAGMTLFLLFCSYCTAVVILQIVLVHCRHGRFKTTLSNE